MAGPRTEEEIWDRLVDEAGEALIEEAASVSVADAEEYLAKAGFDVVAERAKAEAFLASLESGAFGSASETAAAPVAVQAVEQVAPSRAKADALATPLRTKAADRPRRRIPPAIVWAAAATVAAGATALYVAKKSEPQVTPLPPPPPPSASAPATPPPPDLVAAADLRRRAAAACATGHPEECVALLDQARAKDPGGDSAPEVLRMRDDADREMSAKPRP